MKHIGLTQRKSALLCIEKWIGRAALALSLVFNAVCVLIWMETIWRDSLPEMSIFLIEDTQYALCSAMLILLFSLMCLFAFGRVAPALAFNNGFFLLAGIVQNFMLEMRDEPFQFLDLMLIREAFGVVGNMTNGGLEITPYMIQGILFMVVLLPLLFWKRRVFTGKGRRRFVAFASAFLLLVGGMAFSISDYMGLREDAIVKRVEDDYAHRGFLIAFINRIPLPGAQAMEMPENYGPEAVLAVLGGHEGTGEEPEITPNILFVMSESYYDVTMDLKLSEDPLAYFRELQQAHWGGSYVTPVFGGDTVVAEYEVLTGYRVEDTNGLCFTSPGGVIQQGMNSLPSLLKTYGYFTQAIHPGSRAFYSRETSYRLLGFDSLLFRDNLDPVPKEEFTYPSDEYLFEQIIKAYESRPKDRPWFCHTVTYQNHGGYGFELSMNEVRVEEELDEVSMLNAHNYVNMLKLSDDALRDLIAYFDAQEEPTVIVIWGDHAPAIRQFGKKLPESPSALLKYYQTPLMIYSNYGLDTDILPENICSYRLGAYVLRLLGMDRDPFFNYLSSEDAYNIWVNGGLVERDGVWTADPQLNEQEAEKMRMLHYDRLYGKRYGEELAR